MRRKSPSRREFLQRSSAVVASGCVLGAWNRELFAQIDPSAGARQAVACSRREAGDAAREVLLQGGNAIDAAVAGLLVQCVIEPSNVGLGGYGGSLVYHQAKSGRVQAIDFDARAPRNLDPASLTLANQSHGYLAVGVPGVVAGIDLAMREFGTLPFKTLAKASLALAENGISVTPGLARTFHEHFQEVDSDSQHALFPNGVAAEGGRWVQSDLAQLIRRLGDDGPASFYSGDIAATICKQVQANGGVLAEEDFHDFQAALVEPLHIAYRGYDLYTPPLPSGGLTSLSILKTLEQFDIGKLPPWNARYIELFAGASNLAWGERNEYFGDPDFVTVPVEELLSEQSAIERADVMRQATPTTPARPSGPSHTVNLVVIDKDRNLVSWTATHGNFFGSKVAIDGLGLLLGHGMSRFDLKSDSPNYPAAGKRPQHNMSPLLVMRDGQPCAGLGLPGGTKIVTVTAQLAMNLMDFKAPPQQIVSAPRIHTEGEEPIQVTADTPAEVVEELRERGHRVEVKQALGAGANAVVIEAKSGDVQAAASKGSSGVLVF
ncbi:MAG: gamma-glutamyltransferase [Pirellulales bacterium]